MAIAIPSRMTLLDPHGWNGPNTPDPLEAFVDSLSLVHDLADDLESPLFQECLAAAELTLIQSRQRNGESLVGLTTRLWELRQRVLESDSDDGSLQPYILDVMLSIGIGLLVSLGPVNSGVGD